MDGLRAAGRTVVAAPGNLSAQYEHTLTSPGAGPSSSPLDPIEAPARRPMQTESEHSTPVAVPEPLRRVHVIGNSSAGKSSLAKRLAGMLGVPFVELDALNWEPNWVGLNATDPEELERRLREATCFWDRVQLVLWLDMPRPLLLRRAVVRSWRRWRSRELLWGTNYESFWRQFFLWRKSESLIWWTWTQHERKRRDMLRTMADPRWEHIRFVRLVSAGEVEEFVRLMGSRSFSRGGEGP